MKLVVLAGALGLAAAGFATAAPAAAQDAAPVYTGLFNNTAVGGYDAVSFFEGEPVRGDRNFSTEYMGAEFRFANQANLDRFLADPAAFAPQYGGYCAWAMAQGYSAKGDPRYYDVIDGKLYLNFDARVQRMWREDIPGFIVAADENYPNVVDLG